MAHTFAATGVRGLVLISRTKAQLEQTGSEIRTAYPECVVRAFALNISQPDAVRDVFGQSASTFGQVDVLMANAGIMEPKSGALDEADPFAWWNVCVGYFVDCLTSPYTLLTMSRRSTCVEPSISVRLSFSIARVLSATRLQE